MMRSAALLLLCCSWSGVNGWQGPAVAGLIDLQARQGPAVAGLLDLEAVGLEWAMDSAPGLELRIPPCEISHWWGACALFLGLHMHGL
eukprot:3826885-Amphidinium_carterae.1